MLCPYLFILLLFFLTDWFDWFHTAVIKVNDGLLTTEVVESLEIFPDLPKLKIIFMGELCPIFDRNLLWKNHEFLLGNISGTIKKLILKGEFDFSGRSSVTP